MEQSKPANVQYSEKSRITAGILGILLGGIGVHSFYLGKTGKGILQIVVSVITLGIGGLWGFIEGIIIITGGKAVDGQGKPLKPNGAP
ncbi:MAG: TM2 domain-containing protein [Dehalococcoidia bacterium]|nr:TM2 domain-containing protein [Dehalococcoidia bacterium]